MALGLISNDGMSWKLSEKGKKEMIRYHVIREKKA